MQFPGFEKHNGESGKRRALTAKRVAKHRNAQCNAVSVTPALAREEKRRDIPPIVPQGTEGGGEDQDTKPKRKRFKPPTLDEVAEYCRDRDNGINAQDFLDFYGARGWKLNQGVSMKCWKSAVRNWENRRRASQQDTEGPAIAEGDYVC